MPQLILRDLRKDFRLPELRLPEMSRDDIAKALGEARKELSEVRRDLNEFRREFEMPRVDLAAVEMPKVDMPKVDMAKVGKDARKIGKDARKNAKQAAQKAGLVRWPSRSRSCWSGLDPRARCLGVRDARRQGASSRGRPPGPRADGGTPQRVGPR